MHVILLQNRNTPLSTPVVGNTPSSHKRYSQIHNQRILGFPMIYGTIGPLQCPQVAYFRALVPRLILYQSKHRTIEKPYWKFSHYLLSFTRWFHPKWLLNLISKKLKSKILKHWYWKSIYCNSSYRNIDIKKQPNHIEHRVSNTIYCRPPTKARDNVQVFIIHWPF